MVKHVIVSIYGIAQYEIVHRPYSCSSPLEHFPVCTNFYVIFPFLLPSGSHFRSKWLIAHKHDVAYVRMPENLAKTCQSQPRAAERRRHDVQSGRRGRSSILQTSLCIPFYQYNPKQSSSVMVSPWTLYSSLTNIVGYIASKTVIPRLKCREHSKQCSKSRVCCNLLSLNLANNV